jgi:hypothetical protein
MRHRILQYCTNDFLHGSDYFEEVTTDIDYALFQRLPIKNELSGPNIKEIHLERSISNMRESLYVGIARFHGKSKFDSCVSFNLPSKDIVRETKNKFQGSKALCTGIDKIVFCSILPCYPDGQDGGTIVGKDTLDDVEFILNKLKYTKCIIAGDFHHAPGMFNKLETLIESYGFKSYLDNYDTFIKPDNGDKFNLDRMISNIPNLEVSNIKVHQPKNPKTHLAISYDIGYEL